MTCPACQRELVSITVDDLTIEVCHEGCGGLWFDSLELKRVDNPHEELGDVLAEIPANPVPDAPDRKRVCPRCSGQKMRRHWLSGIEVDTCPACAGTWLDGGELATLRDKGLAKTEEEERELFRSLRPQLSRHLTGGGGHYPRGIHI